MFTELFRIDRKWKINTLLDVVSSNGRGMKHLPGIKKKKKRLLTFFRVSVYFRIKTNILMAASVGLQIQIWEFSLKSCFPLSFMVCTSMALHKVLSFYISKTLIFITCTHMLLGLTHIHSRLLFNFRDRSN